MSQRLEFSTLVELLRWRAEHQPNKLAYTFLVNGENEEVRLTYAQLDQQARVIAARLQQLRVTGERALLLYPPGLDFIAAFFGCLYAGVVAVPSYPPRRKRASPRLEAIVQDAQPAVVLADSTIRADTLRYPKPGLINLEWLVTDQTSDEFGEEQAALWQMPTLSSESLAFLQYTSGSTATPKGVMLTHGNLLHNLAIIQEGFDVTTDSRGVTWLPPYHDMGLIGGILEPLYIGSPTTIISPVSFLQKPLRWLQAISRYQATISGGPNFAYDLCIEKITPQERATLDLSSWKVAFTGAELVRAETIERFVAAFEPYGFRREAFYPCYGMAEATLLVAGGLTTAAPTVHHLDRGALLDNQVVLSDDGQPIVGCGHSRLQQKIVIADPKSSTLCSDGQVGEIWLKGASVAKGYWNKPNATEDTFHAYLADTGAGPFLRTGDLGFLKVCPEHSRRDGELFVTGRIKDLIIIRGRNHYPQDIELTAQESHVALQPYCGAAFSVELEGQERVVIVFEVKRRYRKANVEEVADTIRAAVSQAHELQVYGVVLIRPARMAKTTSGKIQRYLCRKAFLEGTLPVIGASIRTNEQQASKGKKEKMEIAAQGQTRADIEAKLRVKIAELLTLSPSKLDLQQPVYSLGLGSLAAVSLQRYIEEQFGLFLPLEIFFEEISTNDLITRVLTGFEPTPQAQPDSPDSILPLEQPSGGHLHNALYGPSLFQSPFHSAKREESTSKEAQSKARADGLIKWLRHYANERINSFLIDERRSIPPYIVLDFGNRGLLGMQVPEQYGGLGLHYRDSLRVLQQLAAIDLSLALFVGNHHILGTRPIINYAQPAVRDSLLPTLAQGRELAAFALTEPGAGSNPRAISTIAVPDGKRASGWRLRGQKSWIGSASWAGVINIFARTVDHHGNSLGLSAFVVRQGSKGLRLGPEALTMGMRGSVQNSIYLNDLLVGPENLLGRVGGGMEVAQDAMMPARLGVAAMSVGGMKRCAQLMRRYAERRTISTGRLLDNPVTLTRLNDLSAAITAVDTLVTRVAMLLDRGQAVPTEIYIACKTSGPEFLWQAADHLVQLLGGRGYIETNIAPKILRDARVLRIFEGPTEPLNMFLGECVIKRGQEVSQFLSAWGVAEIAQELLHVAAQIKQCWASQTTSFSDHNSAMRQAYALTGDVATFAILLAALHSAPKSEAIHHSMAWVRREYQQRVERALTPRLTPSTFFAPASLSKHIAGYTESIGNLEQTLAGEAHGLDDFLRKRPSPPAPPSTIFDDDVPTGHDIIGEGSQKRLAPVSSISKNQRVVPASSKREKTRISPETHQFDRFPEYRYLQQLVQELEGPNPYFTPHEGINNDRTLIGGQQLINYASYNYLGMSGHHAISQASKEAITQYGTSVSASRLASGEIPLHRELERELATLIGVEDCIAYVGGFTTNVSTIGHLLAANDLILHDSLIHSSAIQGAALSGANRLSFPHNDWQALDQILKKERHNYRRVLIIIEGVYSMDGDIPDLPHVIEVKQEHKALLMVDEAHSIGVLGQQGRGIGEYFAINPADVDIWMGTLSKSFASCGGYIAGSHALVEYLKYTAPGFVYSVGMSPSNTAAALAAIRLLKAEPERVTRLHQRASLFLELARTRGLNTGMSKDSAVIPIIVGKTSPCIALAQKLETHGISVLPMIPPAVQDNASRLRFFISSTHTEAQIRFTIETITELLAKIQ